MKKRRFMKKKVKSENRFSTSTNLRMLSVTDQDRSGIVSRCLVWIEKLLGPIPSIFLYVGKNPTPPSVTGIQKNLKCIFFSFVLAVNSNGLYRQPQLISVFRWLWFTSIETSVFCHICVFTCSPIVALTFGYKICRYQKQLGNNLIIVQEMQSETFCVVF
jgi:hypothetical protein